MLRGQVALVTGGASGIGRAFTEVMLQNGVSVVYVADVNADIGQETADTFNAQYGSGRVTFTQLDVSDPAAFEGVFQKIQSEHIVLDIFLNNAGVGENENSIAINLVAAIHGVELAMKYMGRHNGGRGGTVVNTASILGFNVCVKLPKYSISKHGIIALTKVNGDAENYKLSGVRVYAICPALTTTKIMEVSKSEAVHVNNNPQTQPIVPQRPEHVAKCLMVTLKTATPGSLWVVENREEPYEITIPHYSSLKNKNTIII